MNVRQGLDQTDILADIKRKDAEEEARKFREEDRLRIERERLQLKEFFKKYLDIVEGENNE